MILLDGTYERIMPMFTDCQSIFQEADAFLAKRSIGDGNKNETVSGKEYCPCYLENYPKSRTAIFHHLEYFPGILFLTTNLLSNIDPAFLSRCHVHLRYPPLSIQSRSTIWKNFLSRLQHIPPPSLRLHQTLSEQPSRRETASVTVTLSASDLNILAAWNLNGREIKNVVKNAHLWCSYNSSELTLERIEAAIGVTVPLTDTPVMEEGISTSTKRPRLS